MSSIVNTGSDGITGTVLSPAGEPAAYADVGLIVPGKFLQLRKFALENARDSSFKTMTDADGRFTLPAAPNAKAIVAVNNIGFAKVPLPAAGQPATLALQPWGRISGILRIGDRLGANEYVVLAQAAFERDLRFHYYQEDFRAVADTNGRFVIPYAPPGENHLCRTIRRGNGWSTGRGILIDVRPGGVTEVNLGGTGRKVIGKIATNPSRAVATDWSDVRVNLMTSQYGAPKTLQTREERDAWCESEEGQSNLNKMRGYGADVAADGSFVFEEVDPEDYSLAVSRVRTTTTGRNHTHHSLMMGGKKISVPTCEAGSVCDLGTIEVIPPPPFPPQQ